LYSEGLRVSVRVRVTTPVPVPVPSPGPVPSFASSPDGPLRIASTPAMSIRLGPLQRQPCNILPPARP
jgi:hypothetical protein